MMFRLLLEFIAVILAVDFAGGFIHWLEDAYFREDTPLVGKYIARPNIIHHHYPRYFTRDGWWSSSWDLLCVSLLLLLMAWWFGFFGWHVCLFAALGANTNEIHKCAHRTRREKGTLISWLQDIRLLQTPRHHAVHHTGAKNRRYCVVSNLLNPVLDGICFWSGLERLLARTFGLQRRVDTSLQACGPAPKWLSKFADSNRCRLGTTADRRRLFAPAVLECAQSEFDCGRIRINALNIPSPRSPGIHNTEFTKRFSCKEWMPCQ